MAPLHPKANIRMTSCLSYSRGAFILLLMSHITSKLIIFFFFLRVCVCVLFLHETAVLSGLHHTHSWMSSEVSTELICPGIVCLHWFRSGAGWGLCVSAGAAPRVRPSSGFFWRCSLRSRRQSERITEEEWSIKPSHPFKVKWLSMPLRLSSPTCNKTNSCSFCQHVFIFFFIFIFTNSLRTCPDC